MAWTVRVSNTYAGAALSQSEMEANASEIYANLSAFGWSFLAVCGALGNMQTESYLNPGAVENGYPIPAVGSIRTPGGLGLIQWTDYPAYTATKNHPLLWNAARYGMPWYSGTFQCMLLNMCADTIAQDCGEGEGARWGWQTGWWGSMDFYTFKTITGITPEYAAEIFYYYIEAHTGDNGTLNLRKQRARAWYNYFYGGVIPDPEDPDPPTPEPPEPDPDPEPEPGPVYTVSNFIYYLPHPNFRV